MQSILKEIDMFDFVFGSVSLLWLEILADGTGENFTSHHFLVLLEIL